MILHRKKLLLAQQNGRIETIKSDPPKLFKSGLVASLSLEVVSDRGQAESSIRCGEAFLSRSGQDLVEAGPRVDPAACD